MLKNQLIYKNIKSSSSGTSSDDAPSFPGDSYPVETQDVPSELLHAYSGPLIYSDNIILWAQFVFYQYENNLFPIATVNSQVCEEHSTSHIMAVKLNKTSGSMSVRMTLKNSGSLCKWDGSAACTYRLWGGSKTYSEAGGHGKSKYGTCGGGASFVVTISKNDYRIT